MGLSATAIRTQIIEGVKRGAKDPLRYHHRLYHVLSLAPTYPILEAAFLSSTNFAEPLLAVSLPGQLTTLPKATSSRVRLNRKDSLDAHYLALSPSSASLLMPAANNGIKEEGDQPEAEEDVSDEKQQAACIIQAWLQRRIVKRRSTTRFDAFAEMQLEVKKLGFHTTVKRSVLLLGPLVHLYHALQEVQRLLRAQKKTLNKEITSVDHLALDRVMKQSNEMRAITKVLPNLLKLVSPSTTPLTNTNKPLATIVEALRNKLLPSLDTLQNRLEDLLATADSPGLSAELRQHLELGKKGLRAPVVSSNGAGKGTKPSLKVEQTNGVEEHAEGEEEAAEERGRRIA